MMVAAELIPGLPDDVAEQCLSLLPFPHSAAARSVSASWRCALHRSPASARPYLFLLSSPSSSSSPNNCSVLRFLAFDISLRCWAPPLPSPPLPASYRPGSSSFAVLPHHGELFLLGGAVTEPLSTVLRYSATTNSWSLLSQMPRARAFFPAFAAGDRIFAVGGINSNPIDSFDPFSGVWSRLSSSLPGHPISVYDYVAVGTNLYITEGWTWPFDCPPRGFMYRSDTDTWQYMAQGMVDGWTGSAATVKGKVFIVSETGERKVKVYDEKYDTWRVVFGGGVPEQVKKPYVVVGADEGWVMVVGGGMKVGLGKITEEVNGFRVCWQVVDGPEEFSDLNPVSARLLYV